MRTSTETAQEQYDDEDDMTCPACGGSGSDSMEGFMPCEVCDGEGYRWWE
jgi:hypothetical protein